MNDRIQFHKGQLVKIDGIPFILESDTVLLGNAKNLSLIQDKLLGEPSVLRVAQDETSETTSPSSE